MNRYSTLVFAAVLAATGAAPAVAAWDPIGSVDFSRFNTHDAQLGNFRGDAVGLTARGSDVVCSNVMATFGNGRTRNLFRGELPRGQTVTIDLPGAQRSIDRIDFNCRPTERGRARVDIATNVRGYPNDRLGFNYRYGMPTY